MKRLLLLSLLSSFTLLLKGQGNLVPNPNFEQRSNCPTGMTQISYCIGWNSANTIGSPDYFHKCSPSSNWVSVPDNFIGSQNPRSDSAYAGIGVYGGWEYIQAQLTSPLEVSKSYCITYFVSLGGNCNYASIGPQLYLSNTAITSNVWTNFPYAPQIEDTSIIYDTTNWVMIHGEFIATGDERFITIGNFYEIQNTKYDTVGNHNNPVSYFYIDDVSIYEKVNAEAGNDLTICEGDSVIVGATTRQGLIYTWNTTTGLNDSTIAQPWVKPLETTTYYLTIADTGNLYCAGTVVDSITITVNDCTPPAQFYVPTLLTAGELFFISALPENSALELYDARGRLVFKGENYRNDFNTANLSAGVYGYNLRFADGTAQTGKFCVAK
jgi:hypothetical protein